MPSFARITAIISLLALTLLPAAPPAAAEATDMAASTPVSSPGRWIEVDLTTLTATAYEGSTPVFTAPISAGRPGFPTPVGSFRILRRVANETMNSATIGIPRGAPGSYYVTNVRYTQYFTNSGHALHANYWSHPSVFGNRNDSHGCVGLRTDDAAFFWNFATIGTPVIIHRSDKAVVHDVVGMPTAEASEKLNQAGFQVVLAEGRSNQVEPGQVAEQAPAGGSLLERGSVVRLIVSTGPLVAPVRPPEGVVAWVPELVGLSEEEARQRISEAGLQTGYTNYQTESDIPESLLGFFHSIKPGHVLSSSPGRDTQVPRGTVVLIAVRQP